MCLCVQDDGDDITENSVIDLTKPTDSSNTCAVVVDLPPEIPNDVMNASIVSVTSASTPNVSSTIRDVATCTFTSPASDHEFADVQDRVNDLLVSLSLKCTILFFKLALESMTF